MSEDEFFIGWAETPDKDRRFFMMAGLGLITATGATAGGLAAFQRSGGRGLWTAGDIREWRGVVTAEPYGMLYTTDIDGTQRTALLGCQGKCGVKARIGALAGKPVIVRGSLIQRGAHAMIAVIDGINWIEEDIQGNPSLYAAPTSSHLKAVTLRGQILDTKCWFGAMKPAAGKVHKACASLCIRGGIPPGFYAQDMHKQKALMILTDQGDSFGADILEYVADPVEITGTLRQQGDVVFYDTSATQIKRI